MNWIDEVKIKMKKKNQVLFAKNFEYLQDLMMLFQNQNHRVMTLWAFDFAAESIAGLKINILKKSGQEKHWKLHRTGRQGKSKCGWHSGKF